MNRVAVVIFTSQNGDITFVPCNFEAEIAKAIKEYDELETIKSIEVFRS